MSPTRWTPILLLGALVACGGGGEQRAEAPPAAAPQAAEPAPAPSTEAAATPAVTASTDGQAVYARCMACHQANGAGLPGAFPPLAGSDWVTGPASRPIAVVLHGLQGEITVNGTAYNSLMMAYGTGAPLSDAEVAAVVSYIRGNFGNSAPPVTVADVEAVKKATAGRTGPMTVADLQKLN